MRQATVLKSRFGNGSAGRVRFVIEASGTRVLEAEVAAPERSETVSAAVPSVAPSASEAAPPRAPEAQPATPEPARVTERAKILVVNADLPCATPHDLLALLGSAPSGGMALVEAADGTTNALALSAAAQFRDAYGPGSAARFRAHAESLGVCCVTVTLPNLADDVDTLDDLHRLEGRLGRHTAGALASLRDVA